MKDFLKGFKEFALRGNVIDLAVGVVIGAAFGKIVASLVSDIIMPPIGMVLGGIDFTDFFISLNGEQANSLAEAKAAGIPVIAYGSFLNSLIQFLIVAFAIYLVIKQVNRLFPKKEEPAVDPRKCPFCKQEVADDATRCPHCTSVIEPETKTA
ncbi:large conductance mechanosensitive channel protein MscL [uncultured Veillonella sp.]|uniref:large conductance mechanosensitive channel protein MscL n=1 Tax=uncultured Veillonella sp. TaxID=159268 RepID=UPI0025E855CA|nr:large conductance mechanosensitive channel protein MscL [uncultured Veillonella sp.]MDY3974419.1 large conductance mechanosensitive channel protein MscL [Veillonella caviae]